MATLIGTTIGTVGGLAGGLFTAFVQGRQARAQLEFEERRRRDGLRREACDALANAAHQYRMHWWHLNSMLGKGNADRELFDGTAALWAEVTAAHSRAAIAGPTEVAEAADQLLAQLHAMDTAGTEWFSSIESGFQQNVDVLRVELLKARRAVRVGVFASVVRRELGNDESLYPRPRVQAKRMSQARRKSLPAPRARPGSLAMVTAGSRLSLRNSMPREASPGPPVSRPRRCTRGISIECAWRGGADRARGFG
ncbi:hypothetical protein OG788_05665 [Streptomyces sp. NBC_00647]|uniref:hypothetical protein n=1 Tax=Streptomyces sp. NBC_00647 TaxID=2975796 RepID=UPI003246222E